jgi:hypothetical protein
MVVSTVLSESSEVRINQHPAWPVSIGDTTGPSISNSNLAGRAKILSPEGLSVVRRDLTT